jgi:hypothetical protein
MIELTLGKDNRPFMFDINLYSNDICLMFSGGVESTLLLFLLINELKNSSHSLTTYVLDRPNKPLDRAYLVFNTISNLTKFSGQLTTLDIPKVEYYRQLPVATSLVQKSHDTVLWGINKYPVDSSIRPNYLFDFKEDNKLRLPFKNLEKNKYLKDKIIQFIIKKCYL